MSYQVEFYQNLVESAGYKFPDVELRGLEQPRGLLTFARKPTDCGPILAFENEDFGRAFEKANRWLAVQGETENGGSFR